MPSLRSRLLVAVLKATGRKEPYKDPAVLHQRIANERRTVTSAPPRTLSLRWTVTREKIADLTVYTYRPRGPVRGQVVYLHGGSYVFEISPEHHRFCAALAREVGCYVSVPIYPLAPESPAVETQKAMLRVLRALEHVDALVGDSAGGGLALALAQQLARPPAVLMLSPWLDIALDDPALSAFDERDPWLSRAGLREAGRLYAGGLDPKDPRVSPLHGPLDAIAELATIIGTRDLFVPDARALKAKCPRMRMSEYDGMVHDFMLIRGLPEAQRAFCEIVAFLNGAVRRQRASGTG